VHQDTLAIVHAVKSLDVRAEMTTNGTRLDESMLEPSLPRLDVTPVLRHAVFRFL